MTYEEKLAVAAEIRASNFIEPTFEPDYLAWMEQVDCTPMELPVPGQELTVHADLIAAKSRKTPCRLIINVHGGGFVRGHMPCNTYFSGRLAAELGCMVLDISYHLAPEYPYPTAVREAYAAAAWAFSHAAELGADPADIAMVGHSAGASLTLSTAMRASLTKDFALRQIVLDFGAFDLSVDPADRAGASVNVLSVKRMRAFTTLYTSDDPAVVMDPYVSASFAGPEMLKNLPETFLLAAGRDSLRSDSYALADRLIHLGVPVSIRTYLESNHGFTVQCTGQWKDAQKDILRFLKRS